MQFPSNNTLKYINLTKIVYKNRNKVCKRKLFKATYDTILIYLIKYTTNAFKIVCR